MLSNALAHSSFVLQTCKLFIYSTSWYCGFTPNESYGKIIKHFIVSQGAGFIKISQIISSNLNVLPKCIQDEIVTLQNCVPESCNTGFRHVSTLENVIEFENEPINRGSVAEVYQGMIKTTGEKVIIKVLKDNVREEIASAYSIFWSFFAILECFDKGIKLTKRLDKIMSIFMEQVDFEKEVENNQLFQKSVVSKIKTVVIPKIYHQYCTKNMIVMEKLDGVSIDRTKNLLDNHKSEYLQKSFCGLIIQSFFISGCIHCDMHPGNILIQTEKPTIALFDFGLVLNLTKKQKNDIITILSYYATKDPRLFKHITETFCSPSSKIHTEEFIKEGNDFMDNLKKEPMNVVNFIKKISNIFIKHELDYTDDFAVFELALISTNGTLNQISENLSIDTLIQQCIGATSM